MVKRYSYSLGNWMVTFLWIVARNRKLVGRWWTSHITRLARKLIRKQFFNLTTLGNHHEVFRPKANYSLWWFWLLHSGAAAMHAFKPFLCQTYENQPHRHHPHLIYSSLLSFSPICLLEFFTYHYKSGFSCSFQKPIPYSCNLYTDSRLINKQVTIRLILGATQSPSFDCTY